jgi:hypothetical protein
VFMDVDNIPAGVDFVEYLNGQVGGMRRCADNPMQLDAVHESAIGPQPNLAAWQLCVCSFQLFQD